MEESLTCIMSQRLVRQVCPHCKETYQATAEDREYLGQNVVNLQRGQGCDICMNTGYYGRTVVYEYLLVDRQLRRMLGGDLDFGKIESAVKERGFRSMFEIGVQKVMQGMTTIDELRRVIGINK